MKKKFPTSYKPDKKNTNYYRDETKDAKSGINLFWDSSKLGTYRRKPKAE